ncbi:MAG TPA: serine/threonine-protein kinase [Gemmatimonadales bacterium]|nr:serine/threonine-protein kinase [Gemmatimonadales bacterium]
MPPASGHRDGPTDVALARRAPHPVSREEYIEAMTAATPACPHCGTPVPAGARACSNCGADVSGQQGQVATAYSAPGTAMRMGITQGSLQDALQRATIGEYEVKGELGHGGMASVFLAHDIALDRKVAIKVMSPALFSTAGMVERFKREARTAASLSHPHIIPIFAVRESPEIVYFVMKFVEGRSLESIGHQLGQMPVPLVQAILYQVGSALGYAHRRGVVHRDVKPANIMIDADGWSVVTDFGIAKVAESQGLTQTGATIGTPSYMSPEQCAAKRELTGASDQYSLGIVAYEMLSGRLPFQAETTVGLLFAHVHETPEPVGDLRPDLPEPIAAAVMRMLAKEPEDRWPDIETAVGALGGTPIGHDDPIHAQLVELAGGRAQSPAETIRTPISPLPANRMAAPPATRTATPQERRPVTRTGSTPPPARPTPAARRRSPWLWALPILAVAGIAAWWFLGRGTEAPPATLTSAATSAAVETVKVVEPARPETVRLGTPAPTLPPTQVSDSARAPVAPRPAPRNRLDRAEENAYRLTEANAAARRIGAAAAGASAAELAAGDSDARAAEGLARAGRYAEASARLAAAMTAWTNAQTAAQGRPRREGRLAARTELEQVAAEFAAAFSAKSLPRLRVVYPRMTEAQAQEWGQLFLQARDITMQLNIGNVNRIGPAEVEATLAGSYEFTDMRGGSAESRTVSWAATLRLTPMGWRIIALR